MAKNYRRLVNQPFHQDGETGLSIIEMMVAASILMTSAYFTLTAVTNSMSAKKNSEVSNTAAQYEDSIRASLSSTLTAMAETTCFDNLKRSPLVGTAINSHLSYAAFDQELAPVRQMPLSWSKAYERCRTDQGWRVDFDKMTLYGCLQIKDSRSKTQTSEVTAGKDTLEDDAIINQYALVEFSYGLWNLATDRAFRSCTVHRPSGLARKGDSSNLPTRLKPMIANSYGKHFEQLVSNRARSATRRNIPADFSNGSYPKASEYTGNRARGFRLFYSIYGYKRASEGGRRYDIINGERLAGANSLPSYCTTRNPSAAKIGGRSHGYCDLRKDDLSDISFSKVTIEVSKDQANDFFPPPPDPCENQQNNSGAEGNVQNGQNSSSNGNTNCQSDNENLAEG